MRRKIIDDYRLKYSIDLFEIIDFFTIRVVYLQLDINTHFT